MDFEEKTLKRTEIFDGHVIKVVVDDVELPNNLGQAKRELIFHRGAVAILAVTDDNKIILVKQNIVRLLKKFLMKSLLVSSKLVKTALRKMPLRVN